MIIPVSTIQNSWINTHFFEIYNPPPTTKVQSVCPIVYRNGRWNKEIYIALTTHFSVKSMVEDATEVAAIAAKSIRTYFTPNSTKFTVSFIGSYLAKAFAVTLLIYGHKNGRDDDLGYSTRLYSLNSTT